MFTGGVERGPVPIILSLEEQLPISGLFQVVSALGVESELVKVRLIARERVSLAAQTGTDRNATSAIDWHGGTDGERRFMQEAHITDPGLVTYVADVKPSTVNLAGKPERKIAPEQALLVYDPAGLEKLGTASNGFHRFIRSPRSSLIAIFEPIAPFTPRDNYKPNIYSKNGFTYAGKLNSGTFKLR